MRLTLFVQPNAKENMIVSWLDDSTVKVKVKAPAKEGKANKELISFLAKTLKIPKSSLSIIRGAQARMKQIEIPDEIIERYKKSV